MKGRCRMSKGLTPSQVSRGTERCRSYAVALGITGEQLSRDVLSHGAIDAVRGIRTARLAAKMIHAGPSIVKRAPKGAPEAVGRLTDKQAAKRAAKRKQARK